MADQLKIEKSVNSIAFEFLAVQSSRGKYSSSRLPKSVLKPRHPTHRGADRESSRTRDGDAVDGGVGAKGRRKSGFACERTAGARTNGASTPRPKLAGSTWSVEEKGWLGSLRTAKSCGSGITLLTKLAEAKPTQPGLGTPSIRSATVTKIRRRESTKETVKTIAQEAPGVSGALW